MTNEMAIDVLKDVRRQSELKGYVPDTVDKAIEALEKQIPKEPYFEGDGYADGELVYDTWICPNCEEYYEVDYDKYDYCPNCGQAIDWRDEE